MMTRRRLSTVLLVACVVSFGALLLQVLIAQSVPTWALLVLATSVLMELGLGDGRTGERLALRELLVVPVTLILGYGGMGLAMVLAARSGHVPPWGVIALAVVTGSLVVVFVTQAVLRQRRRLGRADGPLAPDP